MSEQIKSIIDRVLHLKEEQDTLGKDIREVYAEAKANGFDKTALGSVVAHLRRKEKLKEKFEEASAIFELYLTAYESGTPLALRAHTHEDLPAHNPETGELTECTEAPTNGEPSSGAAPQGEAPLADTGSEMPAGHGADREGGGAKVTPPIVPPETGELTEPTSRPPAHPDVIAGGVEISPPSPAPIPEKAAPALDEFPDIPDFMRRKRVAA